MTTVAVSPWRLASTNSAGVGGAAPALHCAVAGQSAAAVAAAAAAAAVLSRGAAARRASRIVHLRECASASLAGALRRVEGKDEDGRRQCRAASAPPRRIRSAVFHLVAVSLGRVSLGCC